MNPVKYYRNNKRNLQFIKATLLSPARFLNAVLSILSLRFRWIRNPAHPVVVDLEPTNACNFRCPHCQVTHADWTRHNLSMEEFEYYLPMFHKALRFKLQGMGEPFLNKRLPDMVERACEQGYWVEVISNASLFHLRPLQRLVGLRSFEMTVSLDGASKEVFERVRPGSEFEQIESNIKSSPLPIAAWMVVTTENQEDVEAMPAMLEDWGVKKLGLQTIVIDYGKEELDALTLEKRSTKVLRTDDVKEMFSQRNIALTIADRLYDRKKICPWPWQGMFVDSNGNVVPCCRIGDAELMNMGNLKEQSLDEIWNSSAYQEFRAQHRDYTFPKICNACYSEPADAEEQIIRIVEHP